MSSPYSKNHKELAGVKVLPSEQVWQHNPKTGKADRLNPNFEFVGKVDLSMPNLVLKANVRDKKTAYIEDVSALPKRTKNELVGHFYNSNGRRNNRTVAYLVRTDPKSRTKPQAKAAMKKGGKK